MHDDHGWSVDRDAGPERAEFLPKMKLLDGLLDVDDATNELEFIVGKLLRKAARVSIIVWIVLMLGSFLLAPPDSYTHLEGLERTSHMIIVALQLASISTQILRPLIRDQSTKFVNSGIMVVMMVVQVVAVLSNSTMLFFPTPMLVDPITGARSFLVRWAEWGSLGFLMTFTTECIDIPLDGGSSSLAWLHGGTIGTCIMGGAVLPLCTTWTQWMMVFWTTWAVFCTLFVRIYQRGQKLLAMTPGNTIESQEEYDRVRYSFKIVVICTVVWTALATCFSAAVLIAPRYAPQDSIFASGAIVLLTENVFEVISKILYAATLVEAHSKVFDVAARTARRLEELRSFMSAVWDTSTDVIVMCNRTERQIHGVMNPAFLGVQDAIVGGGSLHGKMGETREHVTTIIEVDIHTEAYATFKINLTEPVTRKDAMKVLQDTKKGLGDSTHERNVAVMAELLREASSINSREMTMMKDFYQYVSPTRSDKTLRCEAKVTKFDNGSLLVVVRDISERVRIFEAEKKLVEEVTARRMDAEANRFTRHEVKNGLLAAIGLLDSLQEVPRKLNVNEGDPEETEFDDCLGELDNTIRDTLDTVLDHAISREVIYGEYEVRKERIQVSRVLSSIRRHATANKERFPLEVNPNPFPTLALDPQLLRCIYQSAVANACVYGSADGPVRTLLSYDKTRKEFRLEVVNLPGEGYEKLLAMDHDEVQSLVFAPGTTLHTKTFEQESVTVSSKSGDGAWITAKCAGTLKGKVELKFERERTVFSFVCPARAYTTVEGDGNAMVSGEMSQLPQGTWGVVIDDSDIQRRLMDRFLKLAGIEKEKRVIVGKNPKEIYGFVDLVVGLLSTHTKDRFLIIADENLEVVEGAALHGTVSGSLCLQKILKEKLDSEQEKRVLALVRSANDSAKDIKKYKSRAHGFLFKAPIGKKGVIESLKPWWTTRFPEHRQSLRERQISRSDSFSSCESDSYDPFHEIKTMLEVIDALCRSCDSSSLQKRWRTIQERLQRLKGDIQTTVVPGKVRGNNESDLEDTIKAIDELRFGGFPDDLNARWEALRTDIEHLIEKRS